MAVARDGYPVGEDYSLEITFISPNGEITVSNAMINGARAYLGIFSQKAQALEAVASEDKNAAPDSPGGRRQLRGPVESGRGRTGPRSCACAYPGPFPPWLWLAVW